MYSVLIQVFEAYKALTHYGELSLWELVWSVAKILGESDPKMGYLGVVKATKTCGNIVKYVIFAKLDLLLGHLVESQPT